MGWPAQILPYPGCLDKVYDGLDCTTKDGSPLVPSKQCAAHIWPEVWRSETDGAKYDEYVLGKETLNSAGTKHVTLVRAHDVWHVPACDLWQVRHVACRADSTGPRSVARGMPSLV